MPSRSAPPALGPRHLPSQARGRQRVSQLLDAAAAVIAERGFAETTMSAIAERAGAAIGSLYQFYPNKEAVTEALRARHAQALEPRWRTLTEAAGEWAPAEIAHRLVRLVSEGARECPAWAELVKAPPTEGSHRRRDLFRRRVAVLLRRRQPRLKPAAALRHAAVVQQLLCARFNLPAQASEFEELLSIYLQLRLQEEI